MHVYIDNMYIGMCIESNVFLLCYNCIFHCIIYIYISSCTIGRRPNVRNKLIMMSLFLLSTCPFMKNEPE